MGRRDFLQLLAAGGAEADQLLGSHELLVIGFEHRPHRQVLHLCLGQLGAEDDGERLATADERAQFGRNLPNDSTNQRVDLGVAVGIRGHRGR